MKQSILILFWALILSSQTYSQNPISDAAKEMLDGRATKFSTKGHPKSTDAVFTIKFPVSWVAKEGERPNIVQKFVDENGHGNAMAMITTSAVPPEESLTKASINEALSSDSLKEMLPEGARLINAQTTKIENEPAGILEYSARMERVGQTLETQTLTLFFFQGRTMVGLQFWLGGQVDDSKELRRQFTAYRPLFNMIMNSIVFDDMWVKGDDTTQVSGENFWKAYRNLPLELGLLGYVVLTVILSLPALLVRYALLRRPLERNYALILTAVIWFLEMLACLALWNKTPPSIHIAAFFSFSTLKAVRSNKKRNENLPSADEGSVSAYREELYKVIARDGKEYGPANLESLKHWYSEGRIDRETMVFQCERNTWVQIGQAFNLQDWGNTKEQTPTVHSFSQPPEHSDSEKIRPSSAFVVKMTSSSEQTTERTLKRRHTFAWSKALLLLGIFAVEAAFELWQMESKQNLQSFSLVELANRFGGSLPEIAGRFVGTLFVGSIASLFAKPESKWNVFIAASYVALFLSIVGMTSPK